MNEIKIEVLDKGFVTFKDYMGGDLDVVNAARVSFGAQSTEWDEKDELLLDYLAKNKHDSPFRHVMLKFHLKAPEFVMRQWYKHVVRYCLG
ncbi:MAG: FAD-dependent thymidylate synthase [Candidatus Thorarchaeota archaeon]|jgi:thymidylate synthase (FAD)